MLRRRANSPIFAAGLLGLSLLLAHCSEDEFVPLDTANTSGTGESTINADTGVSNSSGIGTSSSDTNGISETEQTEVTNDESTGEDSGDSTASDDSSDSGDWDPTPAQWHNHPAHPFRPWLRAPGGLSELAIASDGSLAVAAGGAEFTIIDLSDPAGPVAGVNLVLRGVAKGLALSGDGRIATVASGTLFVVDTSSPNQPRAIGELEFDNALDVASSPDGKAAVVLDDEGLHTVDLSEPTMPRIQASLRFNWTRSLSVAPDFVTAVALGDGSLTIVDLRDLGSPSTVGYIEFSGTGPHAAVFSKDGQRLVVAAGRELHLYNVTDPARPILVRSHAIDAKRVTGLERGHDDDTVLVVGDRGLHVVRLSEEGPIRVYELEDANDALPLPDGHSALVSSGAPLTVVDLRQPGHTALKTLSEDVSDACLEAKDVLVTPDGRTGLVAAREFLVLDVSQGDVPSVKGKSSVPLIGLAMPQDQDGGLVLAVGSDAVATIDISDPANPVTLGVFGETSQAVRDLVASRDGQLAFVSTAGGGIDFVDVSDPTQPQSVGNIYNRHTESVVFSDAENVVITADNYEDGLLFIDVSDLANPGVLAAIPRIVHDMALCGSMVVACGEDNLMAIDITQVEAPTLLAEKLIGSGGSLPRLAVSSDCSTVFHTDGASLRVFDITDAARPAQLGSFEIPGNPTALALFPDEQQALVLTDSSSTCGGTIDLAAPRIELTGIEAHGLRHYRLAWTDRFPDHPEQIAFHATAGDVTFEEVDQRGASAQVTWALPDDAPPEAELVIAVGNFQHYRLARATVAGGAGLPRPAQR